MLTWHLFDNFGFLTRFEFEAKVNFEYFVVVLHIKKMQLTIMFHSSKKLSALQ